MISFLAEILDEQQPRAKSPHMNNEEPIELSHFPSARAPEPHEIPAIERDDFPAPPFPYAVEGMLHSILKLYKLNAIKMISGLLLRIETAPFVF